MAGGYVAYEEAPSWRVGAGYGRRYWVGPGKGWREGDQARQEWAARFPTQAAARAALVAEGADRLEVVGYEWVPGVVEQPGLFPVADGAAR